MKAADRICCDGLCHFEFPCPQVDCKPATVMWHPRPAAPLRLAPGVIEGPHRGLSLRQRIAKATAAALGRGDGK